MGFWSGEEVAKCFNEVKKVNPCGVDLVPLAVFKIPDLPVIIDGEDRGFYVDNKVLIPNDLKERIHPITKLGRKVYLLEGGIYEIRLPRVEIPANATGLCYPRSSFARLGIVKGQTALFDSGYHGEGSQTFFFPTKAIIGEDEAWVQFILLDNSEIAKTKYNGKYQGEKVKK